MEPVEVADAKAILIKNYQTPGLAAPELITWAQNVLDRNGWEQVRPGTFLKVK